MADGCAELIFHYQGTFRELTGRSEKSALSQMHGPSSRYTRYETQQGFGILGVYLYPFAIPQLLSIPAVELSNQAPDLETLFGQDGKLVEENMMQTRTHPERINVVSAFLERQLAGDDKQEPGIRYAIHSIIQSQGQTSIEQLFD